MANGWRLAYNASALFKSGVEAAIAFSFFSVCVFVSMPLLHTHTHIGALKVYHTYTQSSSF